MTNYELLLMDWIRQHLQSEFVQTVLVFFTRIGDFGIVWIALTVLLILFQRTRRLGVTLCITLALMLIINNGLLKNMIERARPCQIQEQVKLLIECPKSFSFPSGHASSSFAVFGVFLFTPNIKSYWKWLVFILASVIAFSRIYLFVHFPSDILVGSMVGMLLAWITIHWIMPKVKV
ncbi:phosphatase PAP2 family protein [Aerococcaceae bacterium zg-B36]|uniref:phosphatase PAP2 family protein n=1 Tax=Aerococcaceae bacterium zg-252 TaxID=2796928 RepID=UPI001BD80116|nr:phosphatase PAP2 family protein [Aerococcaceae bacterium zg-B36]